MDNNKETKEDLKTCLSCITLLSWTNKNIQYFLFSINTFDNITLKKWKKRRMRNLGARIFSKSFGGKIQIFNKDLLIVILNRKKKLKNKTAHAYFERPYFF